ncbi:MAG: hypothetical protein ACJA1C_000512 [Crocinitomicaceae bacterium]|jgi:hypothetical protein
MKQLAIALLLLLSSSTLLGQKDVKGVIWGPQVTLKKGYSSTALGIIDGKYTVCYMGSNQDPIILSYDPITLERSQDIIYDEKFGSKKVVANRAFNFGGKMVFLSSFKDASQMDHYVLQELNNAFEPAKNLELETAGHTGSSKLFKKLTKNGFDNFIKLSNTALYRIDENPARIILYTLVDQNKAWNVTIINESLEIIDEVNYDIEDTPSQDEGRVRMLHDRYIDANLISIEVYSKQEIARIENNQSTGSSTLNFEIDPNAVKTVTFRNLKTNESKSTDVPFSKIPMQVKVIYLEDHSTLITGTYSLEAKSLDKKQIPIGTFVIKLNENFEVIQNNASPFEAIFEPDSKDGFVDLPLITDNLLVKKVYPLASGGFTVLMEREKSYKTKFGKTQYSNEIIAITYDSEGKMIAENRFDKFQKSESGSSSFRSLMIEGKIYLLFNSKGAGTFVGYMRKGTEYYSKETETQIIRISQDGQANEEDLYKVGSNYSAILIVESIFVENDNEIFIYCKNQTDTFLSLARADLSEIFHY